MPFKAIPPLYSVWQSMRRRCLTPTTKQFSDYGGRGISICPEWDSYEAFARDMGSRPPGSTLERIDTNGNYEPSNCRWATRKEQQRNQRWTRFVEIGGNRYKAVELAEINGLKTDTVIERAAAGLPYEQVIAPAHSFITPKHREQLKAAVAARVAKQLARTHCKRGHPWIPANTAYNGNGNRYCIACDRTKLARRLARPRESA